MTKKLVPISEAGLPEAIVGSVLNYLVARNLSDDFAVNTETKKVHVNPAILEGCGCSQPGDKGDKGDKGDTGAPGVPGKPGEDGVDGVDGKSAYQIWLDNGNVGTEQDFLESLRGPKGDAGESNLKDAAVENGVLTITKADGTEVKVPASKCPDVLLTDAFGKIDVGYVFNETCDGNKEEEPKPPVTVVLSSVLSDYRATTIPVSIFSVKGDIDQDEVISGTLRTTTLALPFSGHTPKNSEPIIRDANFSAKFSEFPLTLPIEALPSDFGEYDYSGVANPQVEFSAELINLTAQSKRVTVEAQPIARVQTSGDAL